MSRANFIRTMILLAAAVSVSGCYYMPTNGPTSSDVVAGRGFALCAAVVSPPRAGIHDPAPVHDTRRCNQRGCVRLPLPCRIRGERGWELQSPPIGAWLGASQCQLPDASGSAALAA